MKKKVIALFAAGAIIIQGLQPYPFYNVHATDNVVNTYKGSLNANEISNNSNYADLSDNHWALEPIARMTAINLVKGTTTNGTRRLAPNSALTKEEALAFVVRIVSSEDQAQLEAENIERNNEYGEGVSKYWSRGYLKIAADLGLITQVNLRDAFTEPVVDEDGTVMEEELSFYRTSPVSREQVIEWVVKAINQVRPDLIQPIYTSQNILNYQDYKSITPIRVPYVEAALEHSLIVGNDEKVRPKDNLTRAEMLQILKNTDSILYNTLNLVRKSGIVERILEESKLAGTDVYIRKIQIRNADGLLEDIQFEYSKNQYDIKRQFDAPTYKQGNNTGLMAIEAGDSVEYIIDDINKVAKYVLVKNIVESNVKGVLQPLIELNNGKITIKDDQGHLFTYNLAKSEYIPELNQLKIDHIFYDKDQVGVGNYYKLTLKDDIVVKIVPYATVDLLEYGGVVKEVDSQFGYITIISWENNKDLTFNFNPKTTIVEKQNYYNANDPVGYYDEIFDVNLSDERDADIYAIEVGDLAYVKVDSNQEVTHISAKTNYIMKYGKIISIDYNGADDYSIRVELEDGRYANYHIQTMIPVKKNHVGVSPMSMKQGDWVKLLVNQAIMDPGHITETVKQIVLDTYNSEITHIYKGNLGVYSSVQKTLSIQNSSNLEKIGWRNFTNSKIMELDNNVEVYYNNTKKTLKEAVSLYSGSGYNVFLATERYFDREKVVKINIIDARDTLIPIDNVIYADGNNTIKLLNYATDIKVTRGTIVIRDGRLVTEDSIIAPDYAQVVLGGPGGAAVVNITKPSNNASITISRGRIKEISDLHSMTLSSQGMLQGMNWVFSPIERVYDIDHNTIIMDETGIISLEEFKSYGANTQYDEVFNIVSEGTRAKYVIKSPYSKEGVKGTIYEIEGTTVRMKDVVVYDIATGNWNKLSLTNSYAEIEIQNNAIILKNNEGVGVSGLEIGDQINVLTTENLATKLKLEGTRNIPGYLILVEE